MARSSPGSAGLFRPKAFRGPSYMKLRETGRHRARRKEKSIRLDISLSQRADIESADGAMKPLELEFTEFVRGRDGLDGELNPAVDQDLAIGGLPAEPRAEVHHGAVGRIMQPTLVADIAERGVACGDADAEAELMAQSAPPLRKRRDTVAHLDSHAHRTHRRIGAGDRIVEENQQAVAGEVLQRALEAVDGFAEAAIIVLQHGDDVLGFGALGESGKAAKIAKHHRDVAAVALQ